MALRQSVTPVHWRYFLALEDDLYDLARYVEFSERNYGTYSIEIARLLLSASAEVDSVLKQIAVRQLGPDVKVRVIADYFAPVTSFGPKFLQFLVTMPRYGIELRPWESWTTKVSPAWWRAHNEVKHHRHSQFHEATLKNCLNAMAALLVSVVHLHAEEGATGNLVGIPRLFSIPPEMGGGQHWGALGHCQLFYLHDEENPFFS